VREAHTVEQIRAAEAALMQTVPDGALMLRAAAGLAAACIDLLGGAYGRRVVVLAGSGNNGGDALFAGAALARRGAGVEVVAATASPLHAAGLQAALRAGARVVESVHWPATDLVVDGVVGIGGQPGLREPALSLLADAESAGVLTVAVDVPSGVDVDGGTVPAAAAHADVTVTFGTHKPALLAGPAAEAAGVVHLVDIGLDPYLPEPGVRAVQAVEVAALLPVPSASDHKYSRGVLGVRAGSAGYAGAARLCVAGASAGLAGMIRYDGPEAVTSSVLDAFPEVVVGAGRVQAWVVGPGGGDDAEAALSASLSDEASGPVPVLVDADGLRFLPARLDRPALLTPHAGELARLLDVSRDEVEADPLRFVREAAGHTGATVLLKGARTLVAEPGGGPVDVVHTGSPWLATAGAGDVLAGLAGSLLAAGCTPRVAGVVAAWLHGSASRLAGGPVTATAVARALPEVITGLVAGAGA
jgi:hydroxyethylthiazole kinase-like uncharacterized protein yjeF